MSKSRERVELQPVKKAALPKMLNNVLHGGRKPANLAAEPVVCHLGFAVIHGHPLPVQREAMLQRDKMQGSKRRLIHAVTTWLRQAWPSDGERPGVNWSACVKPELQLRAEGSARTRLFLFFIGLVTRPKRIDQRSRHGGDRGNVAALNPNIKTPI